MSLSTHILDTALGLPAGGIPVSLEHRIADAWTPVTTTITDPDGRARDFPGALPAGVFRLHFETAPYFQHQGLYPLHPFVEITFEVTDPAVHLHIPLLLTANGYTTYRGS